MYTYLEGENHIIQFLSINIVQLKYITSFLVDGLKTFTTFLKTEFSEENIEFWIACEDFKKSKDPQQIIVKAKAIYEKFIQNDAPQEVQ